MIHLDYIIRLLSGALPFCLTVFTGSYYTFATRFFQIRNFVLAFKILKGEKLQGISGFSAMCNSLSAAIGTGNIVGVAAALSLGGAGSVFWMWISSFLGMVIKSGEIALGVFYRNEKSEEFIGGPHIYIQNALPKHFKFLAFGFAFFGLISTVFGGNMAQINSAVSGITDNIFLRLFIGAVAAAVVWRVISGGTEKIADFLSKMLPFMAIAYILLCIGVIVKNYSLIPVAFKNIFVGAFSPKAVTGGAVGSVLNVISTGAAKGIFSNEAGLGTAAVAHAGVTNAKPFSQSLYGIFEVFADTTVMCTLTALTILTSGVIIDYNKSPSAVLTINALSTLYGSASAFILNVMLLLFGVSSVIGWATYGVNFCRFLFKKKGEKSFMLCYPLFCAVGAVLSGNFVWKAAELSNGILVIINLFAMMFLSKEVLMLLKEKGNDRKENFKSSK